jgi:hypothetical protein
MTKKDFKVIARALYHAKCNSSYVDSYRTWRYTQEAVQTALEQHYPNFNKELFSRMCLTGESK